MDFLMTYLINHLKFPSEESKKLGGKKMYPKHAVPKHKNERQDQEKMKNLFQIDRLSKINFFPTIFPSRSSIMIDFCKFL